MIGGLRISLAALRHNASALSEMVGPKAAAFVVKSNAYGHGLVETALAIEGFASRLCVYDVEEAIALRDGGVTKPILALGPVPAEALERAHAAKVEISLWDTHAFLRRVQVAGRKRRRPFPVHVKINTGLNRLGLDPGDLSDALENVMQFPEIEIAGIFSHLASAEELDSPYTMHQLDVFERAYAQSAPTLAAKGLRPLRHLAASAAAMLWPQTRLDLSRFGIALYGLWPSPQTREAMNSNGIDLRPALSYHSTLAVVRTVPAGEPIGYGNSFHAPRDLRVGVVPCGYADGVPRALSNRGAFLVDGARCPIVGRVAMNVTEVDLTGAPGAHAGSQVTLIGRDGEAEVVADEWAQWCETINYEIVARLPAELPREYVEA
ncbi:MAG: alanine racemase [Vulcanimicrobiaceae bacterium]